MVHPQNPQVFLHAVSVLSATPQVFLHAVSVLSATPPTVAERLQCMHKRHTHAVATFVRHAASKTECS
jgi:hypothetical protein